MKFGSTDSDCWLSALPTGAVSDDKSEPHRRVIRFGFLLSPPDSWKRQLAAGAGNRTKLNMFRYALWQVCLDGHSPSFAPANRQTLSATNAHGVGQVLHSRNQNEKYGDELKSVSIFLVRVTGLEPAPPCKD